MGIQSADSLHKFLPGLLGVRFPAWYAQCWSAPDSQPAHRKQRLHNMFCGILSQGLITRLRDEAVPAGRSCTIMQHIPEIHQPERLRLPKITDTLGEGLCKAGIERIWT